MLTQLVAICQALIDRFGSNAALHDRQKTANFCRSQPDFIDPKLALTGHSNGR
jgi:hypothetical protein